MESAGPRQPDATGAARPPLTRERILEAALHLVEREGPAALSMRRLARDLGVEAMSLYNHVGGKAEILDGLAELFLIAIELPPDRGESWEDRIRALARAFRKAALANPKAAALMLTRQLETPASMRPTDASLAVFLDAGFDEESAVHGLRAFIAFQIGTLLREVTSSPAFSGKDPAAARGRAERLAASGFPSAARVAPHLATCDHEAEYYFGVEALLTAMRVMLSERVTQPADNE
jgi:TetR/AcrR family tetracycline transcriptional repressor